MRTEHYLGSIKVSSEVDEARLKRLESNGASVLRNGSLAQVFGSSNLTELFSKVSGKTAFRGDLWLGPPRDPVRLHLDAQLIVKMLVPMLREAIHEIKDPAVVMNGLRHIGHGTSFQILDRYHNTKLDIHVSTNAWDRENWVCWRLCHWDSAGKDVFKEKEVPYPEAKDFDEKKERMKVVRAILSVCKDWLKERRKS